MQLTFLQIAQRAYREAGFQGAISTVLNQTGRAADVVNWVQVAHEKLQLRRRDWNVDWAQGTFDLTAGKDTYNPAVDWGVAGGIRNFERDGAYVYRAAAGLASRMWVRFMEWPLTRELGVPPVPGLPIVYSLKPDGSVYYYPYPQEDLKAVHEYWRHPQVLAADADIPRIPADFHMALVWGTVMIAADFNKDWTRKDSAEEQYEALLGRLEREQSPDYVRGGPLA